MAEPIPGTAGDPPDPEGEPIAEGEPNGEGESNAVEATPAGRGMGPARMTALAVGVVVAAMVVLLAIGRDTTSDQASALLGGRTPPVQGQVLTGGTFDIDDHRGSWVLVNFFATWCPPCVAEHPDLVALERWGAQRGDLQLVSVVFNDPVDAVTEFFDRRGGDWPVIDNPEVAIDFQVSQVPESFLVSPSGRIVLQVEGQLAAPEVQRIIEESS